MKLSVVYQKIQETGFPEGYYYAHLPELGLTTHGLGIEGAKAAAIDLAKLWIEEKQLHGEAIAAPSEIFFSDIEIPENALQSA